jgi:predicted Zn-ribbon and HTH transcriptional regulator
MTYNFDQLLGTSNLPHDTCQKCGRLYTTEEVQKYGYNNPSTCPNCMTEQERNDNNAADAIVNDLRKHGR